MRSTQLFLPAYFSMKSVGISLDSIQFRSGSFSTRHYFCPQFERSVLLFPLRFFEPASHLVWAGCCVCAAAGSRPWPGEFPDWLVSLRKRDLLSLSSAPLS